MIQLSKSTELHDRSFIRKNKFYFLAFLNKLYPQLTNITNQLFLNIMHLINKRSIKQRVINPKSFNFIPNLATNFQSQIIITQLKQAFQSLNLHQNPDNFMFCQIKLLTSNQYLQAQLLA